jgi:hypothetical protein
MLLNIIHIFKMSDTQEDSTQLAGENDYLPYRPIRKMENLDIIEQLFHFTPQRLTRILKGLDDMKEFQKTLSESIERKKTITTNGSAAASLELSEASDCTRRI